MCGSQRRRGYVVVEVMNGSVTNGLLYEPDPADRSKERRVRARMEGDVTVVDSSTPGWKSALNPNNPSYLRVLPTGCI